MKALILACTALFSVALVTASFVPACAKEPLYNVGGIWLTAKQARQVHDNFEYLRRCPTVLDPYSWAPEYDGNDCTGGQSGTPKDYGGGGS